MGPSGSGLKMIRTIWLATICLAVLSTLAVGKALMTRNPSSATERRRTGRPLAPNSTKIR